MLTDERDGVDADVSIGENVLLFGVHAAVECAHAKDVGVALITNARHQHQPTHHAIAAELCIADVVL
jgi:LDH2 family malate/lactate/ureidoglycolate dehydrogenase